MFFFILFKKSLVMLWVGDVGLGDGGLGIGDWGLGPIPNPQSPIPIFKKNKNINNKILYKINIIPEKKFI